MLVWWWVAVCDQFRKREMSAQDVAQISACLRNIALAEQRRRERFWRRSGGGGDAAAGVHLLELPGHLLYRILAFCDLTSLRSALAASRRLAAVWEEGNMEQEEEEEEEDPSCPLMCDMNDNTLSLDCLPADVLLTIFKYLDQRSLGRVAQVCRRFRELSYSDCVWLAAANRSLASNQLDPATRRRSQGKLCARERVRVGQAWRTGACQETVLTVHNNKFMPRLQLEREHLWVSWGKFIWCHPRLPEGGIGSNTTKMLRGHSDDVSRFVVCEGMVVSGGRDRSICGWSARTGEFLFARRYCHAGEVTAVDVTARGRIIVSGSRDRTLGVWALQEDLSPFLVNQMGVGDRVWSLSVCPSSSLTVVGTAAQRGVPPLRLFDLSTGQHLLDLGAELRNGAGQLDLAWLDGATFLGCGYDTCTRLWDTRCSGYVRTWEEPFDESVYCLGTDRVNLLVTGTARHGRVRVWDMRAVKPLYMKHATPARQGQSSPVYSLCLDAANIYVALDKSLSRFGFS